MEYLALIYVDENVYDNLSPAEQQAIHQEYMQVTQAFRDAGVWLDGRPLEGTSTATSIRIRDGKQTLTDGPYAETKEHLGGFYLFDCENLDEAVKYAAMIPGARYGTIEVRPVMPIPVTAS
ncbi:MAG TPA: YciI family protein [Candidatus Sulfotelmatobacter sp.]|nr:YciI family protein [Candidatus Sulfotelmatobacter sp.]